MRDKWKELKQYLIETKKVLQEDLTYQLMSDSYYIEHRAKLKQIIDIQKEMFYLEERSDV